MLVVAQRHALRIMGTYPRRNDMKKLITALQERITDHNARSKAAQLAYKVRFDKFCGENNDGALPTYDAQGRAHAPRDDYRFCWFEGNDMLVDVFAAGSYLPFDKELHPAWETRGESANARYPQGRSARIANVELQIADDLCKALDGEIPSAYLDVSSGMNFDVDGVQKCHIYVKTQASGVIEMIEEFIYTPQRKAADAAQAKQDALDAAAQPVPVNAGRIAVCGTVLTTKIQESQYGSTLKMLVRDDRGFKLWGSVPSSIYPSRGDTVEFVAAVEPSDDDPKFGFYKRPTKAECYTTEEVAQ